MNLFLLSLMHFGSVYLRTSVNIHVCAVKLLLNMIAVHTVKSSFKFSLALSCRYMLLILFILIIQVLYIC